MTPLPKVDNLGMMEQLIILSLVLIIKLESTLRGSRESRRLKIDTCGGYGFWVSLCLKEFENIVQMVAKLFMRKLVSEKDVKGTSVPAVILKKVS